MWWEAPESMIQELEGSERDTLNIDADVPKWVNVEVETIAGGSS